MENRVSCFEGITDPIEDYDVGFITSKEEVEVHSNCYFAGKNLDKLCNILGICSGWEVWLFLGFAERTDLWIGCLREMTYDLLKEFLGCRRGEIKCDL